MEAPSGGATPKSRHVQHGARKSGGVDGVAYQRVPAGVVPRTQPASHVSKCGRRRRERRPLAVVPSVNIKTPSSSPTPSLCASLAQIYMIIKEARRERTRRRAILLTYSLPYSLIHPLADPQRTSNNFNANINRRWMDYRGWNPLKRKFLVSRDRPVSYVYHRSLVVSSINF